MFYLHVSLRTYVGRLRLQIIFASYLARTNNIWVNILDKYLYTYNIMKSIVTKNYLNESLAKYMNLDKLLLIARNE